MKEAPPGRHWARLGFGVGIAASVAANVAHSYLRPHNAVQSWTPQTGAIAAAAFWPLALLISIEVISRVEWPDAWHWKLIRYGGLTAVAVIAAIISYRHMSQLLRAYGEDAVSAAIGPLAVDGFMVVCSGALLAIGHLQRQPATADGQDQMPSGEPLGPHLVHDPMPRGPASGTAPRGRQTAAGEAEKPHDRLPRSADDLQQEGQKAQDHLPTAVSFSRLSPKSRRPHAAGRQDEARQAYEKSVAAGLPLTGKELGQLFHRGERWGRDRIAEARIPQEEKQEEATAAVS